jgi:hypothetical protein
LKPTLPVSVILTFCLTALLSNTTFSQISIQSTKGYAVNINIQPEEIVYKGKKCTYGYNYNIKFSYTVTFTGNNAPKSLYTLQGTISNKAVSHFFQLKKKPGSGTETTQSNVWRGISDCETATVTSMDLSMVNVEIEGEGISARTVSYPLVVALPVRLVSFSAELNQPSVKLKWTTATETNNDFFNVERSTDENRWTVIKKVKGAGNSNSLVNYEAYDDAPVNGTAYYRIAQTDLDGTTTYSGIKIVKNVMNGKGISIYPVPATGNTINFAGISDYKNNSLTLRNAGGSILFSTTLSKASVELPSLATGVYFVRVMNKVSGEATNLRFVKI